METMIGISLYSYLYLKIAKMLHLTYYHYVFSSTELEKMAEQVLPGSKVHEGRRRSWEQRGELAQTMYVHMNK
jgi:hypothetical protein